MNKRTRIQPYKQGSRSARVLARELGERLIRNNDRTIFYLHPCNLDTLRRS